MQELFRLDLGICAAIILLGAWRVMNYHPVLLALLPALFLYQFSSYFTSGIGMAAYGRQRLAMFMESIVGALTGVLMAFVAFDPIIALARRGY